MTGIMFQKWLIVRLNIGVREWPMKDRKSAVALVVVVAITVTMVICAIMTIASITEIMWNIDIVVKNMSRGIDKW